MPPCCPICVDSDLLASLSRSKASGVDTNLTGQLPVNPNGLSGCGNRGSTIPAGLFGTNPCLTPVVWRLAPVPSGVASPMPPTPLPRRRLSAPAALAPAMTTYPSTVAVHVGTSELKSHRAMGGITTACIRWFSPPGREPSNADCGTRKFGNFSTPSRSRVKLKRQRVGPLSRSHCD